MSYEREKTIWVQSVRQKISLYKLLIFLAIFISPIVNCGEGEEKPNNFYISGRIATEDGVGLQGVTVEMTMTALYGLFYSTVQTTTDADGRYSFANSGYMTLDGRILPSMQGYIFTPASRLITITPNIDIPGQDFVATRVYSISGKVTTVNGVSMLDISVTLVTQSPLTFSPVCTYFTNIVGSTISTATINSGDYRCYLPNGTYTITPSKKDFTFTPSSRTVTLSNADVTGQDFVSPAYSVSGRIVAAYGSGLSDATLSLIDVSTGMTVDDASTDSQGYYTLFAPHNGLHTIKPANQVCQWNSYTYTPYCTSYYFTPENRTITIEGADLTGQDFAATRAYFVSGRITTTDGAGLPGVSVALTGTISTSDVTDSEGDYFVYVPNGSYTITPSMTGYSFTPASISISVNNGNVWDQNFVAQ